MSGLTNRHPDLAPLMRGLELVLDVCDRLGLPVWPDFGTLLGYRRHGGIIPWDYDVDLCLMKADYDRLVAALSVSGSLPPDMRFDAAYYGEPRSCACLLLGDGTECELGVDLVAYEEVGDQVRSLMSPELIAEYPDNYDFARDVLFPLGPQLMLGRPIGIPNRVDERLAEIFGDWRAYPEGHSPDEWTGPPALPLPIDPEDSGAGAAVPALYRSGSPHKADTRRLIRIEGDRPEPIWLLAKDAIEALGRLGSSPVAVEECSFTELVTFGEGALWGRVFVGLARPGDCLVVPVDSHAFRPGAFK